MFVELKDFGQKVGLTRRIREVLLNYPKGTTVLKELIQNCVFNQMNKCSRFFMFFAKKEKQN